MHFPFDFVIIKIIVLLIIILKVVLIIGINKKYLVRI